MIIRSRFLAYSIFALVAIVHQTIVYCSFTYLGDVAGAIITVIITWVPIAIISERERLRDERLRNR